MIPAAFSHPAKISLALVRKIFSHAVKNDWIKKGDAVLDPFAGIGGVAFGAMAAGLKFVGQELEPHFVELANGMDCTDEKLCPTCIARSQQSTPENLSLFDEPKRPHRFEGNLEFWKRKFNLSGAVILQGDSRKLLENLRGRVECVVSSPVYLDARNGSPSQGENIPMRYGSSIWNLGNLPAGNFDAVISSPPYAQAIGNRDHEGDQKKYIERQQRYNDNHPEFKRPAATSMAYGSSSGQLSAMPEGCFDIAVSSPPFEDMEMGCNHQKVRKDLEREKRSPKVTFGNNNGQLGGSGETFWSAAREIVQQCFLALKPGGHAIWVTKRFVRNGEIVEFSQQWAQLCEAVGFKLVCWHHAMLTENGAVQMNIEGEETQRRKERKSFFRRLAEKNGSPHIDWEDVICMIKPKNAL